jgi:hypothetical protein
MYPELMVKMLAAEYQREQMERAAHERFAAAMVGHHDPWWSSIVAMVRRLSAIVVRRQGPTNVSHQMPAVEHA